MKKTPHTPAAPAERLCDECNIIELEEKLADLEQQINDEREQAVIVVHTVLEGMVCAENPSGRHLLREADVAIAESLRGGATEEGGERR